MAEGDDRIANPSGTAKSWAPGGGGLDLALGRALGRAGDAALREGNRLALFGNGPDTYDDWLAAIGRARRWVHLDNYIFASDGTGERFARALGEKAREGVAVRVLRDWFGTMGASRSFWRGLEEAGVEVRVVNPPTFGAPLGVVRRDHRKLVGVDGEYASTGGVCISDGWLVTDPETGLPFRDTAVSVRGPAVADLERAFAGVWDESGVPLPRQERPPAEGVPMSGGQAARVVVQEPRRMRTLRMLEALCNGVERRLWITDPYFLSTPTLSQSLMAARQNRQNCRGRAVGPYCYMVGRVRLRQACMTPRPASGTTSRSRTPQPSLPNAGGVA